MIASAKKFEDVLAKHFEVDDWEAVEIFLAAVAAHFLPGNMFWVRIIGASGSLKSEVLLSLQAQEEFCISADTFTPGAIRGGYKPDVGTLPRMLEEWNKKLVITKDFASVISKKKEDRGEVFGLLRNAWDGTLDAFYGSDDSHVKLKFHFDWIVATTPYIERQRSLEAELGSRFIDIQWSVPEDKDEAVMRAMNNEGGMIKIRQEVAQAMTEYIAEVKGNVARINGTRWIAKLANTASALRTPVYRDIKHEIYDLPTPELGTRLGQGMLRIASGLAAMGITEYKPYMIRMGLDCMPRLRKAIVQAWLKNPLTDRREISKNIGCSEETVRLAMEDMKILGLTKETLSVFNGNDSG